MTYPYCGDNILQSREQCDRGAQNGQVGSDCSVTCRITKLPFCGDTIIQAGEECDDGNVRDGDGCNSLCKIERKYCTDGTMCGNNVCRSGRTCEDAYCGDGVVQSALNEECDDGNRDSDDDCDNTCKWVALAECGDGIVQSEFELCDNGNDPYNPDRNSNAPNAECRLNCMPERCGDGIPDDFIEECDDGNNINGDGCSSVCTLPEGAAPPPTSSICLDGSQCVNGYCKNGQQCGSICLDGSQCVNGYCKNGQQCGSSYLNGSLVPGGNSSYYPPTIPTPARTPTGPGLVIFLASGAAAGVGVVRRRFLSK